MTSKAAPVTLLVGDDAFLLREAALELLGDLRPREVDAAEWQGGELGDLATPSLFGEPRALLVTNAKALTKDAIAELASYLAVPDPSSRLILCCRVERGKAPAALLKVVEPLGEVKQVQVARKDLETWLVQRAKRAQLDLTPQAARALVGTIGEDLGQLASSLDQLADVFPSVRVTPELIHAQFRGLGDQKVWDLCDRALRTRSARRDPVIESRGGRRGRRAQGARRRRGQAARSHQGAGAPGPSAARRSSRARPGSDSNGRLAATSSRRATSRWTG